MANTVTRNILNEGPSKIIIQLIIEGDGSGDLDLYSVLDPVTDFNQPLSTQLTIQQIWASTSWFDVLFSFNAVVPAKTWVHSRDADSYYDFRYFGGLKDQSTQDPDGKLLISTSDLTAGSVGTLIIELKKN
jgi:hypothetical protein